MIGRLLLIEWVKARGRLAFWIGILGFTGLLTIMLGGMHWVNRVQPGTGGLPMPGSWPAIFQMGRQFSFFLTVVVIFLVAAENGWRTRRQNIMDGLSRDEYLLGKALFALLLVGLFWALTIGLGTLFGWMDSRLGESGWTIFAEPIHFRMMGGFFLYLILMATIALFLSTLLSGSGPALAAIVLVTPLQGLVIMAMMRRGGFLQTVANYSPLAVTTSLGNPAAYDPVAATALMERSDLALPASSAALAALGYIALLLVGTRLLLRYRDL